MSLLPYALRPKIILRRTAFRRGAASDSVFWRALSIYFIRGPKVLRSQAMMRAFSGSRKWRLVGAVAILSQEMRAVIVKQPEMISEERLRPGQFLSVATSEPMSRKERKRTGITRKVLEQQALADVAAAKAADSAS